MTIKQRQRLRKKRKRHRAWFKRFFMGVFGYKPRPRSGNSFYQVLIDEHAHEQATKASAAQEAAQAPAVSKV